VRSWVQRRDFLGFQITVLDLADPAGRDPHQLGAGFGVSRAMAYWYVAEGVAVLAARAPGLHEALQRVAGEGWSYVILDGKLFDCDRVAETTISVKGDIIDAWYSGKHRDFGANIQAIISCWWT